MNSVCNGSTLKPFVLDLEEEIWDGFPSKKGQITSVLGVMSCSVESCVLHEIMCLQHHLHKASYLTLKLKAKLLWCWVTGIDHPRSRTIKQEVQQSFGDPEGLNKELLTKLKHKKESYKGDSRIRSGRRKIETLSAHAGMQLGKTKPTWSWILATDVTGNKSFFRYIESKRKASENTGLLLNGNGVLVTKDMEELRSSILYFLHLSLYWYNNPRPLRSMEKSGAKKIWRRRRRTRLGNSKINWPCTSHQPY